jgi:hypothetical protein
VTGFGTTIAIPGYGIKRCEKNVAARVKTGPSSLKAEFQEKGNNHNTPRI